MRLRKDSTGNYENSLIYIDCVGRCVWIIIGPKLKNDLRMGTEWGLRAVSRKRLLVVEKVTY